MWAYNFISIHLNFHISTLVTVCVLVIRTKHTTLVTKLLISQNLDSLESLSDMLPLSLFITKLNIKHKTSLLKLHHSLLSPHKGSKIGPISNSP